MCLIFICKRLHWGSPKYFYAPEECLAIKMLSYLYRDSHHLIFISTSCFYHRECRHIKCSNYSCQPKIQSRQNVELSDFPKRMYKNSNMDIHACQKSKYYQISIGSGNDLASHRQKKKKKKKKNITGTNDVLAHPHIWVSRLQHSWDQISRIGSPPETWLILVHSLTSLS